MPEAGLADHFSGTAARDSLARHLWACLRAAGPPTAGRLLHTLGAVVGRGPPGSSRNGGRQGGPPFPRCRPGRPPRHLVGAYADAARLVLGQRRVDSRSNEITAIPELLEMMALDGCIVTIDAMGGQKRIAQTIRYRGPTMCCHSRATRRSCTRPWSAPSSRRGLRPRLPQDREQEPRPH